MSLATQVHKMIDTHNVLKQPTQQINSYFRKNRDLYKVALLANHLFRTTSMAALMHLFPSPVSFGFCFAGSLFYRLTVETNCAFKFALPTFGAACALLLGQEALTNGVSGVAFTSLRTLGNCCSSLLPLAASISYIVLTVSYDADHRCL